MGNYTIFLVFENPRRGRQARNFTKNVPKILDLKSSSEQIFSEKLTLGTPGPCTNDDTLKFFFIKMFQSFFCRIRGS